MMKIDSLFLVSMVFGGFMLAQLLRDGVPASPYPTGDSVGMIVTPAESKPPMEQLQTGNGDLSPGDTSPDILPPYAHFTVTQGLHGFEYGHRAVDLSAGKGAPILSPIRGVVTQNQVDVYGNTILVIENERYRVTLLHGNFTVQVGEQVEQGQVIGAESNQGLTYDLNGRSCAGRDCGYHTHINIYDKMKGKNINPLKWFNQS